MTDQGEGISLVLQQAFDGKMAIAHVDTFKLNLPHIHKGVSVGICIDYTGSISIYGSEDLARFQFNTSYGEV